MRRRRGLSPRMRALAILYATRFSIHYTIDGLPVGSAAKWMERLRRSEAARSKGLDLASHV